MEEVKQEMVDISENHNIWIQISSSNEFDVSPSLGRREQLLQPEPINPNDSINNGKLDQIIISQEKWPFLSESQVEVSSRELTNEIKRLKTESTVAGIEFLNLTKSLRDYRKKMIKKKKVTES